MPPLAALVTHYYHTGTYRLLRFDAGERTMVELPCCPSCGGEVLRVAEIVGAQGEVPLAEGVCLGCGLVMHLRRPGAAFYEGYYGSIYGAAEPTRALSR